MPDEVNNTNDEPITPEWERLKALIPARPTPISNPANPFELVGSRQIRYNTNGVTGSFILRGFLYDWVENGVPVGTGRVPFIGKITPAINSAWSSTLSYLRLKDIEFREVENGMGEATCNYTSEGFVCSMKTSITNSSETHIVPNQVKWNKNTPSSSQSVANPYVEEQEISDAYMEYKVSYTVTYAESLNYNAGNFTQFANAIAQGYNAINSTSYHGFPAESMRCIALDCEPTYTMNTATSGDNSKLIAITTNATFKIYRDHHSHNLEWMPPTPLPDSQGNEIRWHNMPNQDYPYNLFYTTDIYKIGNKVFTDDVQISTNAQGQISVTVVTPTPTHGGWYKPYIESFNSTTGLYTQTYLYSQVNFASVLGIPDLPAPVNGGA